MYQGSKSIGDVEVRSSHGGGLAVDAETMAAFFERIAQEEGWQPGGQLRAHRAASIYFAAYVGHELAGGMQVVVPVPGEPFPFHDVWPEATVPTRILHVIVLAIQPERRGHLRLFWPLLVELWRFCVARDVEAIVIEATPPMLARYRRLGFELTVIGELRPHWGEDCYLCQADATLVAGAMLRRAVRSPAFRAIVTEAMRPLASASFVADAHCAEAVLVPSWSQAVL